MILLVIYVSAAVGFSFLCSLLEASFLSARDVSLIERVEQGDQGARLLLDLKRERVDDALSAILILNTVANTAGATLAGAQAKDVFGDAWVGLFTGCLILLILIGSEIVPKTLGAVYSSRLVGFTGQSLRILTMIFGPLLRITSLITSLIASEDQVPISRGELATLITNAAREGILAHGDSRVVTNVLSWREVRVEDVMTPRTVVIMLQANSVIGDLLDHPQAASVSRIPLYTHAPDDAEAYILQRDVLAAAANGAPRSTPLTDFQRKALYVPSGQTVGGALQHMAKRREHLALVTDEFGGISGLVTMEDLFETLLGIEIVDESDRIVDLRKEAVKLRERRLRERQPPEAGDAAADKAL